MTDDNKSVFPCPFYGPRPLRKTFQTDTYETVRREPDKRARVCCRRGVDPDGEPCAVCKAREDAERG